MLLLSWLAGVPLPVAAAVFDMGKRGHKQNRSPPSCANVHACAFRLVSGRVTFVSAVNFSSARIIAVLFMALVISAYLCKFLIFEGLGGLMCWRN